MIREVIIKGKPLLSLPLRCQLMGDNSDSPELSEFVALVEWTKWVTREQAKWPATGKVFTSTHVRASLDGQPETIRFLDEQFELCIRDLIV